MNNPEYSKTCWIELNISILFFDFRWLTLVFALDNKFMPSIGQKRRPNKLSLIEIEMIYPVILTDYERKKVVQAGYCFVIVLGAILHTGNFSWEVDMWLTFFLSAYKSSRENKSSFPLPKKMSLFNSAYSWEMEVKNSHFWRFFCYKDLFSRMCKHMNDTVYKECTVTYIQQCNLFFPDVVRHLYEMSPFLQQNIKLNQLQAILDYLKAWREFLPLQPIPSCGYVLILVKKNTGWIKWKYFNHKTKRVYYISFHNKRSCAFWSL